MITLISSCSSSKEITVLVFVVVTGVKHLVSDIYCEYTGLHGPYLLPGSRNLFPLSSSLIAKPDSR